METTVSDDTFEANKSIYFSTLSEEFWRLIDIWSDIRKRYIDVHGWYTANNNFFASPKIHELAVIADTLIHLKKSIDSCVGSIDDHGYWLSKKMNQVGVWFANDSFRPLQKNAMDEIKRSQTLMSELIFRFYEMEESLKSLSMKAHSNGLLFREVMASLTFSHGVKTIMQPSHDIRMNVQPSHEVRTSLKPECEGKLSEKPSENYRGGLNLQPTCPSFEPSYLEALKCPTVGI